ncbi:MAG: ABC transporter permease [Mycobacteriales bacterium]
MIAFIIRRLLAAVLLLLVVGFVTFIIFFWVPKLAGQNSYALASQFVGKDATQATVRAIEKKYGFDKPVIVQYWRFMKNLVTGTKYDAGPVKTTCNFPCFGVSFKSQTPVWPLIKDRIPVTMSLAIGAAVIWLVSGVIAGVISAVKRGKFIDRAVMAVALAGVSAPIFFTGLVALSLFSYKWPLFPNIHYVSILDNPFLWFGNLVLPWVTLALLYGALYARLMRAGMLETLNEDYIRTARAKGLPERTVIAKHAVRAALTPILTIFGLDLGLLVGGAILTEYTFSLPGVGQFAKQAIDNNDLPEIFGVTLVAAFFVIMANLVVDILYAVIDPRVRLS